MEGEVISIDGGKSLTVKFQLTSKDHIDFDTVIELYFNKNNAKDFFIGKKIQINMEVKDA